MQSILRIFLSIIFISVNSLLSGEIEEVFKKNIPADDISLLSLENKNGDIEIRSWDNNEVGIKAYKKVRADNKEDALKLLDELEIIIEKHGAELEVITEYPHNKHHKGGGFFSWLMGYSNGYSYSVSYEVLVPKKFDLNIESTNGKVEVFDWNQKTPWLLTGKGVFLVKAN